MNASTLSFQEQLHQFSLFQGFSNPEMMQLTGNTRFDFLKVDAGKTVVKEGDVCNSLYFLVKGTVSVDTYPDDRSYRTNEELGAPWLIQPEVIFGLSLRYTFTVKALDECRFILLSKDDVLRLFDDILTFRLNMLNLLASLGQQRQHKLWRRAPQTLRDRIIRFITDHCVYPAGPKKLYMLMQQLALEVNDSRLDVSKALNEMQRQGLVELHRGCINIPMLEYLFR